ncbi:MAG TPA: DUF58 domain-containing protein [Tepidisphaeraceae bacterium]|nr:DUF58 domain-containing protein [Tepidisphaeraceae bacterium]
MADSPPNLLDPETISQAEALGLAARQVVEGYMSGEHKSPFRGFSIEFTQHREYVPGDDTRHLDWKVLGRTERYYLKQYEQETNYVAHLLIDGSESMRYGSGVKGGGRGAAPRGQASAGLSKFDYAKRIAACLAYVILHQRDAISLSLFDDAVRNYVPRTGSLGSMHGLMATLAAFGPSQKTNVGDVLHNAAAQIRRRGIVILISDLFDDEQKVLDGIQHLRFGGNEVIVFHVMDPFELQFPFDGNVEFEGLEGYDKMQARPHDIRKSYLAEVTAFQRRMAEGCERNTSHYVLVDTSHPLHEVLAGYLAFRHRTTVR